MNMEEIETESAFDWWRRSRRSTSQTDSNGEDILRSAVTSYLRPGAPNSEAKSSGTRVSYIDAALRLFWQSQVLEGSTPPPMKNPVLDIRGDFGTGKTWTLITLAAQFVVDTRSSIFPTALHLGDNTNDSSACNINDYSLDYVPRPRVLIFDSTNGITVYNMVNAIRTMLLRKLSDCNASSKHNEQCDYKDISAVLNSDLEDCLGRIHIATTDNLSDWVSILEMMRYQLGSTMSYSNGVMNAIGTIPTLLLWDGFLSEPYHHSSEAAYIEVIRQLERLLASESSPVLFVSTTTDQDRHRCRHWDKFVAYRIHLSRNNPVNESASSRASDKHPFLAQVHGSHHPFAVTDGGIVS